MKANTQQWLYILSLTICFLITSCSKELNKTRVCLSSNAPQVLFALNDLKSALGDNYLLMNEENKDDSNIILQIDELDSLKSEGFTILKEANKIVVTGFDEAGLMYGTLELTEQINLYGFNGVESITHNPYMEMRGSKFNIPLDVRTPSYSDASDSGQKNIPHMWDFAFWKEYIDTMARYRYNYISLWNLHPFPSMVKVQEYPDVALDDVQRSTTAWNEYHHNHATGLDTPEILDNPETVLKITIDEKIKFWQRVMQYASDRNIEFYIITWNIFVNGTDGKYGITDKIDNGITKDYFKQSIKAMFKTYPNLKGIGLTTGENMHQMSFKDKEDWAFDTYAKAILEIADELPSREFKFIHRQHQTGAKTIAEKFKPIIDAKNVEFLFSFKYAKAHVYSATEQHYHQDFVKDIAGMKTLWELRNDDTYYLRWGAPDFVREFIKNIPSDVSKGIFYGSDQWIWGRDFLTKNPETPNQLEIVKHWYDWMLWGRLNYDPTISNDRFKDILQNKFPDASTQKLFHIWQQASMVYPTTTGFHWGEVDYKWYIEGCKSQPRPANNQTGFHDVNRFITLPPHPKTNFQSIPDYVKLVLKDSTSSSLSPFGVSEKLHSYSNRALEGVENFKYANSKELEYTINDIICMAYLGKYYAHKIAGATNLALYRETHNASSQNKAIEELKEALSFWTKYTESLTKQNHNPLWTNRVGIIDWEQITKWVSEDIEIAKSEL